MEPPGALPIPIAPSSQLASSSSAAPSPLPGRPPSVRRRASKRGAAMKGVGRPSSSRSRRATELGDAHDKALEAIRSFLKERSSYDVLPVSFRLIVLDTKLIVKPALDAMFQAGVVSAPLWNSDASRFAGMLTVNDIIHLIQYYYHNSSYDNATQDVERFRLEMLRDIEQAILVPPPPLLSIHPLRPLYDACQLLIRTHARRLPLLDHDDVSGQETVLSVLTQYRVLKFIAMNCRDTAFLNRSIRSCNIGTYVQSSDSRRPSDSSDKTDTNADMSAPTSVSTDATPDSAAASVSNLPSTATNATSVQESDARNANPYAPLATATLDTTVFDVVHMFSERGISAVPILDADGGVVNLYETVDVITLVRTGAYHDLNLTISQALARRSPDFPGVVTCSPEDTLADVFTLIRKRRVHRLVVIENDEEVEKDGSAGVSEDGSQPLAAEGGLFATAVGAEESRSAWPTSPVSPLTQPSRAGSFHALGPRRVSTSRSQSAKYQQNSAQNPPGQGRGHLSHAEALPRRRKPGRLVGIVCLSDVLRYVIGGKAGSKVEHWPAGEKLPVRGVQQMKGVRGKEKERDREKEKEKEPDLAQELAPKAPGHEAASPGPVPGAKGLAALAGVIETDYAQAGDLPAPSKASAVSSPVEEIKELSGDKAAPSDKVNLTSEDVPVPTSDGNTTAPTAVEQPAPDSAPADEAEPPPHPESELKGEEMSPQDEEGAKDADTVGVAGEEVAPPPTIPQEEATSTEGEGEGQVHAPPPEENSAPGV